MKARAASKPSDVEADEAEIKEIVAAAAPSSAPTQAEKAVASPKAIAVDTRKQRMRGNRSLAVLGSIGSAAYAWSEDALAIWEKVPAVAKHISKSLQKIAQKPGPITEVKEAAADLETAAQGGKAAPAAAPPPPAPASTSQI